MKVISHNIECKKMTVQFFVTEARTVTGVIFPKLCHGDTVITLQTGEEDVSSCDGLVTKNRDLAIGVSTADCAPICFSDGTKIAVIHAGWRGLCLGIVERALREFETQTVEVFVGPLLSAFAIQKDFCYEAITKKFRGRFLTTERGEIIFHFREAIASCLPSQARFDNRDTGEEMMLPSHRRDKMHERLLTVVHFT